MVEMYKPEKANWRSQHTHLIRLVTTDSELNAMELSQKQKWQRHIDSWRETNIKPSYPVTERNILKYWKNSTDKLFSTNIVSKQDKQSFNDIENKIQENNKRQETFSQENVNLEWNRQKDNTTISNLKSKEEIEIAAAEMVELLLIENESLRKQWMELLKPLQDKLYQKVKDLNISSLVLNDLKPVMEKHSISQNEIDNIINSFKRDEEIMLNALKSHQFNHPEFFGLTFP